jgi:hypothetical protein
VGGLFAFVWLELVYPDATYLGPVRLWFSVYVAVPLLGNALFGSRWFERADPFEVYSTLVGHLAVLGRRHGRLVLRSPLAGLSTLPAGPGLVAVVAVLFGSTAFDSFRDANYWLQVTQSTSLPVTWLNTVVMLVFCAVVGATLVVAARVATPVEGVRGAGLPASFAHVVVPIVVGYVVARYWLTMNPTFFAVTKVLAVVVGHLLGVVAAHDRAVHLLPERHRLTGQLPLPAVMLLYTVSGLYLLFGA